MSKITSKLQVTLPKAIADAYGLRPGDDIAWIAAGDSIRVLPAGQLKPISDRDERLRLFDQATQRQELRGAVTEHRPVSATPENRGWTREDLYERGSAS